MEIEELNKFSVFLSHNFMSTKYDSWDLLFNKSNYEWVNDYYIAKNNYITREIQKEKLIDEISSYNSLCDNWDGENALKPDRNLIKEVVSLISLFDAKIPLPEPMLLSSGHIGLFWNEDNLYVDIEFLDNSRIAYFIKKDSVTYKGIFELKP